MKYSVTSKLARALLEAERMSVRRAAPGQVPFKQTELTDPHIQQIVQAAAQKTGVPAQKIMDQMQKHVDQIAEMKKYSYLLYDTAAKNAAQDAAFDLIEHSHAPHLEQFDPVIFIKLVNMIQLEHEQFFPLRAPGETNYIFTINPILIPSNIKVYQRYNQIVNTAMANSKGEFFFNVPFMQKLITFAEVEGLKPKGKKYKSNGGRIPDSYAYIEFLIMHELLHYTYGDFTSGARLPQFDHTVHNYASDFRSNYMLVKSGYDQLPMGLFSDHINYDRQGKYKEICELVDSELKKLPQPLQDKFKELADLDDHPPPPQPPQPPPPPQPPKPIKVGDVVKDKKSGGFWKVTAITPDGKIDTRPATPAEVTAAQSKSPTVSGPR
jgi:hypothetical protein